MWCVYVVSVCCVVCVCGECVLCAVCLGCVFVILPYDGEKRTLEPEDIRTLEPGGGGGGVRTLEPE